MNLINKVINENSYSWGNGDTHSSTNRYLAYELNILIREPLYWSRLRQYFDHGRSFWIARKESEVSARNTNEWED